MSLLSAQCDELRRLASTLDTRYRYADDIATALREAADTILSLRDRAQELQAHNAKLRKERDMYRDLVGMMDHPDLNEQLQAENAKLRELVRDAWGDGHLDRSCGGCDIRDECHDDIERLRKDGMLRFSRCLFELRIEDRMRELGIEVDE